MKKWFITQGGREPADIAFLLFMTADEVKASLMMYSGYNDSVVVEEAQQ